MDNHIREEKVMTDKRKTQYKQLGLNIAYYRRLKGLTQSDLAEAVNLSRTTSVTWKRRV